MAQTHACISGPGSSEHFVSERLNSSSPTEVCVRGSARGDVTIKLHLMLDCEENQQQWTCSEPGVIIPSVLTGRLLHSVDTPLSGSTKFNWHSGGTQVFSTTASNLTHRCTCSSLPLRGTPHLLAAILFELWEWNLLNPQNSQKGRFK